MKKIIKSEKKDNEEKAIKNKRTLNIFKTLFFIFSGIFALVGCIATIVEFVRIQKDLGTSFPAWAAFVFYLLPYSFLAFIFFGAALLCGYFHKRTNKKITTLNKNNIENTSMTYGEKIYTLREKNGISQEELAEKLDVSRQTISNWENDKVKIDIVKAKQICDIFHISIEEFCAEEVPQESVNKTIPLKEEANKTKKNLSNSSSKNTSNNKKSKKWQMVAWIIFVLSLIFMVIAVVDTVKTGKLTIGSMIQLKSSWWMAAIIGFVLCTFFRYLYKKNK